MLGGLAWACDAKQIRCNLRDMSIIICTCIVGIARIGPAGVRYDRTCTCMGLYILQLIGDFSGMLGHYFFKSKQHYTQSRVWVPIWPQYVGGSGMGL